MVLYRSPYDYVIHVHVAIIATSRGALIIIIIIIIINYQLPTSSGYCSHQMDEKVNAHSCIH